MVKRKVNPATRIILQSLTKQEWDSVFEHFDSNTPADAVAAWVAQQRQAARTGSGTDEPEVHGSSDDAA